MNIPQCSSYFKKIYSIVLHLILFCSFAIQNKCLRVVVACVQRREVFAALSETSTNTCSMVKTNIPQNLTFPGLNMATKRPHSRR
jgi:hypothetical protein